MVQQHIFNYSIPQTLTQTITHYFQIHDKLSTLMKNTTHKRAQILLTSNEHRLLLLKLITNPAKRTQQHTPHKILKLRGESLASDRKLPGWSEPLNTTRKTPPRVKLKCKWLGKWEWCQGQAVVAVIMRITGQFTSGQGNRFGNNE